MNHNSNGVTLSPKVSFILGLTGGVLVLCTIGFFILLGLVLGGNTAIGEEALAAGNPAKSAAPSAPVPAAPADNGIGDIAPINDSDHVEGPASAEVTLYVYTDIECPFCSRFHPSLTQAMEEYEGQIKTVFRHFPLSFHANARPAANAAECAGEQDMFFEYVNELFENNDRLGSALFNELAGDLGLNKTAFSSCINSAKYDDKISADMAGGIATGIKGTPGTIIVGQSGEPQLVPGAVPLETLKGMIEAAL